MLWFLSKFVISNCSWSTRCKFWLITALSSCKVFNAVRRLTIIGNSSIAASTPEMSEWSSLIFLRSSELTADVLFCFCNTTSNSLEAACALVLIVLRLSSLSSESLCLRSNTTDTMSSAELPGWYKIAWLFPILEIRRRSRVDLPSGLCCPINSLLDEFSFPFQRPSQVVLAWFVQASNTVHKRPINNLIFVASLLNETMFAWDKPRTRSSIRIQYESWNNLVSNSQKMPNGQCIGTLLTPLSVEVPVVCLVSAADAVLTWCKIFFVISSCDLTFNVFSSP